MRDDGQRLDALRQGLAFASENGFVAIRAADLRWLIDRVEPTVHMEPHPLIDGEEITRDPERN